MVRTRRVWIQSHTWMSMAKDLLGERLYKHSKVNVICRRYDDPKRIQLSLSISLLRLLLVFLHISILFSSFQSILWTISHEIWAKLTTLFNQYYEADNTNTHTHTKCIIFEKLQIELAVVTISNCDRLGIKKSERHNLWHTREFPLPILPLCHMLREKKKKYFGCLKNPKSAFILYVSCRYILCQYFPHQ